MKRFFILFSLIVLVSVMACSPEKSSSSTNNSDTSAPTSETNTETATDLAAKENPAASTCTYSTNPDQIKMQWTAYKFTEKAPVKGTFTSAQAKGPTSASSLSALAKGLRMSLDGATIDSGDPGRNITVKDFFFAKFNPPFKMEAWIKDLQGSDTQGNLMVVLQMNGVTKEVPFAYTATPEGEITAKGGINLMNWNLQPAFDSIHRACETLHTGKDGVSKTWDVVDLKITGKFKKQCRD